MKTLNKLLVFIIMVVLVLPVLGQTDNQNNATSINFSKLETIVPGKFYYKDGTVKDQMIKYQNPEDLKKLDNQIHFLMDPDNPKKGIINSPKSDLEAFEIDKNKWVRMTYDGEEQFGILHIDGVIKDFSVFKIPFARVTGDYIEKRFIQKQDEKPISNSALMMKYKKTIVELVKDNKELAAKITNKEKGYKGFINSVKVINEYNEWHKTEYPDLYK
jgi:hypothetical protein